MLDLQPGIDLEKPERLPVEQELHGAGGDIPEGTGGNERGGSEAGPQRLVHRRGGRLLDDLLMAALDGAFALEEVHHVTVAVAQDLDLDVTGRGQPAFQENGIAPESAERLPPGRGEGLLEIGRLGHDPHPAPAPAVGALHEHRITDLAGDFRDIDLGPDLDRRQGGHSGRAHRLLGGELVPHDLDDRRRRTHPETSRGLDRASERGIFGEKAVARMDRIGAGALACRQVPLDIQIRLGRRPAAERDRPIGLGDEGGAGVGVSIDRDRLDPHRVGGPEDPARDLAPVRDEKPADGPAATGLLSYLLLYIRHVPNSFVP